MKKKQVFTYEELTTLLGDFEMQRLEELGVKGLKKLKESYEQKIKRKPDYDKNYVFETYIGAIDYFLNELDVLSNKKRQQYDLLWKKKSLTDLENEWGFKMDFYTDTAEDFIKKLQRNSYLKWVEEEDEKNNKVVLVFYSDKLMLILKVLYINLKP